MALAYSARGFHTFILRYSTGRNCAGFAPLKQVDWVIGYLRENAEAWHIDPNKILTCGFSAGGHVALSAGLLAENKPNGMILSYPAVAMPNIPGANFMLKLLMGKENVRLLVNRIRKKLFRVTDTTVDDMMDTAGLPLLGIIPEDENVTLSASFNQPLLCYKPRCAASKACARIAKRITGLPVPIQIR